MDKKKIIPQQTKPVMRVTSGGKSDLLSELSEELIDGNSGGCSLSWWSDCAGTDTTPIPERPDRCKPGHHPFPFCAYDGDEAE